MRRRLLNLVTALSLLLCVALCVLWARSYWRRDSIVYNAPGELSAISSNHSSVYFERNTGWPWGPVRGKNWQWRSDTPAVGSTWDSDVSRRVVRFRFLRFAWAAHDPPAEAYRLRMLIVPYWSLTLLTAILPAIWFRAAWRRRVRRRRDAGGLCPACGYDLRATPGRCPECGAAASV
jgi:hypothetical protein